MRNARYIPASLLLTASAMLLTACGIGSDGAGSRISGVPLAELDRSGPPPSAIRLGGSDRVIVVTGSPFDIRVSGDQDAVDALRFTLKNNALGIGRMPGTSRGQALIRVTTPETHALVLGGSGDLEADRLTGDARITIGGSGSVKVSDIDAENLAVTIGGSGTLLGSGRTRMLDIKVGGSGDAQLAGLEADQANVSVGGSGDVAFASDGAVSVSIAGSGDVTVDGEARCSVSKAGSGTVTCGRMTY